MPSPDATPVDELRETQLEIRLVQNKLADINSTEKNHPKRTKPGDSHEMVEEWRGIKAGFEKRRRTLKERYAKLEERRLRIERALDNGQQPMTKATIGHIINKLTDIEAKFTVESVEDAWDSLTAFIDWLETEAERAPGPRLAAVA